MNFQPKICTDDYGDALYLCCHTKKIVGPDDSKFAGSIIPNLSYRYAMENSEHAESLRKESVRLFNEHDANCNTCRHLERVKHEKRIGCSALYGLCKSDKQDTAGHPYANRFVGDVMVFYPPDYMGMKCYEARWSVNG